MRSIILYCNRGVIKSVILSLFFVLLNFSTLTPKAFAVLPCNSGYYKITCQQYMSDYLSPYTCGASRQLYWNYLLNGSVNCNQSEVWSNCTIGCPTGTCNISTGQIEGYCPVTPTPSPTRTPTPSPTTIPTPCRVTTAPILQNLNIGQIGTAITARVTSGLGLTTITNMSFGSYNPAIATATIASDSISPYQTKAKGVTTGNTAIWATATLSDGRKCPSVAATDTNITINTTTDQGAATTLETAETDNYDLCTPFFTDEGEISCEEAEEIALKKYPGQLLSVDKTILQYETGILPEIQTKEAKVWIIGIKPDDLSTFPLLPKDPNNVNPLTTDTIKVVVDQSTKEILFLKPFFKE